MPNERYGYTYLHIYFTSVHTYKINAITIFFTENNFKFYVELFDFKEPVAKCSQKYVHIEHLYISSNSSIGIGFYVSEGTRLILTSLLN